MWKKNKKVFALLFKIIKLFNESVSRTYQSLQILSELNYSIPFSELFNEQDALTLENYTLRHYTQANDAYASIVAKGVNKTASLLTGSSVDIKEERFIYDMYRQLDNILTIPSSTQQGQSQVPHPNGKITVNEEKSAQSTASTDQVVAYMSPDQLAQLQQTNPTLAQKQQELYQAEQQKAQQEAEVKLTLDEYRLNPDVQQYLLQNGISTEDYLTLLNQKTSNPLPTINTPIINYLQQQENENAFKPKQQADFYTAWMANNVKVSLGNYSIDLKTFIVLSVILLFVYCFDYNNKKSARMSFNLAIMLIFVLESASQGLVFDPNVDFQTTLRKLTTNFTEWLDQQLYALPNMFTNPAQVLSLMARELNSHVTSLGQSAYYLNGQPPGQLPTIEGKYQAEKFQWDHQDQYFNNTYYTRPELAIYGKSYATMNTIVDNSNTNAQLNRQPYMTFYQWLVTEWRTDKQLRINQLSDQILNTKKEIESLNTQQAQAIIHPSEAKTASTSSVSSITDTTLGENTLTGLPYDTTTNPATDVQSNNIMSNLSTLIGNINAGKTDLSNVQSSLLQESENVMVEYTKLKDLSKGLENGVSYDNIASQVQISDLASTDAIHSFLGVTNNQSSLDFTDIIKLILAWNSIQGTSISVEVLKVLTDTKMLGDIYGINLDLAYQKAIKTEFTKIIFSKMESYVETGYQNFKELLGTSSQDDTELKQFAIDYLESQFNIDIKSNQKLIGMDENTLIIFDSNSNNGSCNAFCDNSILTGMQERTITDYINWLDSNQFVPINRDNAKVVDGSRYNIQPQFTGNVFATADINVNSIRNGYLATLNNDQNTINLDDYLNYLQEKAKEILGTMPQNTEQPIINMVLGTPNYLSPEESKIIIEKSTNIQVLGMYLEIRNTMNLIYLEKTPMNMDINSWKISKIDKKLQEEVVNNWIMDSYVTGRQDLVFGRNLINDKSLGFLINLIFNVRQKYYTDITIDKIKSRTQTNKETGTYKSYTISITNVNTGSTRPLTFRDIPDTFRGDVGKARLYTVMQKINLLNENLNVSQDLLKQLNDVNLDNLFTNLGIGLVEFGGMVGFNASEFINTGLFIQNNYMWGHTRLNNIELARIFNSKTLNESMYSISPSTYYDSTEFNFGTDDFIRTVTNTDVLQYMNQFATQLLGNQDLNNLNIDELIQNGILTNGSGDYIKLLISELTKNKMTNDIFLTENLINILSTSKPTDNVSVAIYKYLKTFKFDENGNPTQLATIANGTPQSKSSDEIKEIISKVMENAQKKLDKGKLNINLDVLNVEQYNSLSDISKIAVKESIDYGYKEYLQEGQNNGQNNCFVLAGCVSFNSDGIKENRTLNKIKLFAVLEAKGALKPFIQLFEMQLVNKMTMTVDTAPLLDDLVNYFTMKRVSNGFNFDNGDLSEADYTGIDILKNMERDLIVFNNNNIDYNQSQERLLGMSTDAVVRQFVLDQPTDYSVKELAIIGENMKTAIDNRRIKIAIDDLMSGPFGTKPVFQYTLENMYNDVFDKKGEYIDIPLNSIGTQDINREITQKEYKKLDTYYDLNKSTAN